MLTRGLSHLTGGQRAILVDEPQIDGVAQFLTRHESYTHQPRNLQSVHVIQILPLQPTH